MFTIRLIIAINVLVFLAWNFPFSANSDYIMFNNFLVSWDALVSGRPWVLLTSVFSHNMFLHIFLNMFVLNSFGPIIYRTLGRNKFIGFYLIAGIFSSLCHAAVSAFILDSPALPALGASGAIAGLILLFSMLYPHEKILLFGIVPIPALYGALAFIGLDIWGLVAQAGGSGLPIGHGAHLGGSLVGIIYFFLIRKRLMRFYY